MENIDKTFDIEFLDNMNNLEVEFSQNEDKANDAGKNLIHTIFATFASSAFAFSVNGDVTEYRDSVLTLLEYMMRILSQVPERLHSSVVFRTLHSIYDTAYDFYFNTDWCIL